MGTDDPDADELRALLKKRQPATPLLRGEPESRLAKFRQTVARFRLYRHRSLQENTRFSAFFEIYKII